MNKALLKSKMVAFGDTNTDIAQYLKISDTSFSYKLNGKSDFSRSEIAKIKNRYSLTADDIDNIFFSD